MKKSSLLFLFLSVLFLKISFSSQPQYSRAKIWFDGKPSSQLSSLGIDLSEGELRQNVWFVSDFSEREIERIKLNGFQVEILIDDVGAYYRDRNQAALRSSIGTAICNPSPTYNVPANFHLGSMGGFFTYSEMNDILDSMMLLYPNLILELPIDSTPSIEGNIIYYYKISDNPNTDEGEPEVMYDALHHAREPESMSQLLFYMWYLLENYDNDTTVKALVDNVEMFFIPIVNPDGYIYNEFFMPNGGGMWRKNRRDNLDGEFGVDLNRNYGYQWGYDTIGSSVHTDFENYRGTSAFSEPETQAMRNFLNSREILLAINYHTYGNHHIIPYGYVPDLQTPDSAQYYLYGNAITRYNHYQVGTTNQTLHYLVNGVADDWMYGEQTTKQKIFSMTPEIGNDNDGFWPLSNRIIPLSQENLYANLMLAKLAGRYGQVVHSADRYVMNPVNYFSFAFQQLGLDTTGTYTISLVPLTPNILSTGSAVTASNLSVMQEINDSISYSLSPSLAPGELIQFLVTVSNGLYTEADTITQIYGIPFTVLDDNASNAANWNAGVSTWGTTTEDYVSPPSSFTDSPFNFYLPNNISSFELSQTVSLSGALDARLTFYTKYFTERQYDYVQVLASNDNGSTWSPLCGKYTEPGKVFQIIDQPEYDGLRSNWVHEEMSLNDYLGEDILIKFELTTDNFQELDGFYFDDLKIELVDNSIGIRNPELSRIYLSQASPNPSKSFASVNYSGVRNGSMLVVNNILGEIAWLNTIASEKGTIEIPSNELSQGVYSYFIVQPDGSRSRSMKMMIQK